MKRILVSILTAVMLLGCSSAAFADHHDHDRDHHEWRKEKHKKKHKKEEKYFKKRMKEERKARKYYEKQHRKYAKERDKELRRMVRHACRGGRDVAVWQISDDTYIVRYNRGGRYYTQRLYPYTGRYGGLNSVSLDWSPESVWTLLPSISVNLNF